MFDQAAEQPNTKKLHLLPRHRIVTLLESARPKGFHDMRLPGYFFQLFLSPPVFRNRLKKTCAAMCAGRSNTADDPSARKGYTGTANRKVGHAHF
jgi:hypothetical protein